jgi:radical SAM superfamily enzyme YgiQ (UPF0313 family)
MSLAPDREPIVFWSSFYPLGCLVAYAKVHRDGSLLKHFDFARIRPRPARQIPKLIQELPNRPAVYLLSSYVWNHDVNVEFARALKRRTPGALVVVGGPQVPRIQAQCEEFLAKHPYFDVAVRQEGEITLAEILTELTRPEVRLADLSRVDLTTVTGLTFRRNGVLVRTPDRPKTPDIDIFPSPYTTGEFDEWIDSQPYLPLETNRGCPYGCTFCDWGSATLSKVARMSMERVLAELEFAAKHRIANVGICDANFGILPRDVDIARAIVDLRARYGYPTELGYTNAKTASPRLTEIIKILHDGGLISSGQISMQTTDEKILENVERANIKMSEYRKMITFFHKEEIPAVSDIMLGLPGQTLETCKRDLQFCFDHKVTAMIFATSVMPNAPMADEGYRRKFQIEIDDEGLVESTYSFTREEYGEMFDFCLGYKLFVKLGLLKYLLYFAQIEHGVPAMDFVSTWLTVTKQRPGQYPISGRVRRELLGTTRRRGMKDWLVLAWTDEQAQFLFDSLEAFYAEIVEFYEREHGVRLDGTDAAAILAANREVMPRKDRALPARVSVDHDVAGYFALLRALPSIEALPSDYMPLKSRGPGSIDVKVPATPANYGFVDGLTLLGKLELASNVRI